MTLQDDALNYHAQPIPGKLGIAPTKACATQQDLSLAYTPGVAVPCLEIAKNPDDVYKYTNRGNSVAIVSDGTAILGLGAIGPMAGLPVMEGKAVIFKKFADIDAYPLCMDFSHCETPEKKFDVFVDAVRVLEPSFAGINLEDIAAPLCFDLQVKLDGLMGIPAFHDDQDGTAIIISGGLMNALKVIGKKLSEVKIIFNGAGAAGIACARQIMRMGARKENISMCDSKGLITDKRADINEHKKEFAQPAANYKVEMPGLGDAIEGMDVFIGVSVAGALKPEMVSKMNKDSIIFAVANPVPEIMPDEAYAAGARLVATGRSDFPNQVNNALGYPGIFRGALDTRAVSVNEAMKVAASEAIASLIDEPVEGLVKELLVKAYPKEAAIFDAQVPLSEKYIIPKQFDLRVVPRVARMVAKSAMESGVARFKIEDLDAYEKSVFERVRRNW
ncbi:MAG: malic enzyme-like NAD(P)-binding protein [Patescibacteria group bacterium]